jgi:hypothetical protein
MEILRFNFSPKNAIAKSVRVLLLAYHACEGVVNQLKDSRFDRVQSRITVTRRVPVAEYPKPQRGQSRFQKLWHRVLCHRHPRGLHYIRSIIRMFHRSNNFSPVAGLMSQYAIEIVFESWKMFDYRKRLIP